jgi:O-antigen/teichoic acid export membrane protein
MFTEERATTTDGLEIPSASMQPAAVSGRPLRARVIEGVVWLTATRLSGQIITWIITVIVVRLLSPEDYGLMGMAVLFTGVLYLFNEIGLGAAIVQRTDLSAQQLSDLRWVIVAVNVALFAVLLPLAPPVAAYFGEPKLVAIIRVLAIAFLLNGIGVPSASILQREMAFKEKAAAEIAGNLAAGVSTLVLAVLGYGVWSLVFGSLILRLVTTVLYCVYRPPVFNRSFSLRNVGLFTNFGFHVTASRFLWYVYSTADMAIIGKVLGSTQLGYYSLAFQYSSLPLEKFVTILNEIAFPSFSSVQHDTATLQRHYLKLVNFVALVTFPMFIGLSLVADSAVVVFLGARWLPVVLPLRILCVVLCFRAIETIHAPLAMAKGRPQVVLGNTMLGAIVLPPSFYIGARYAGIEGVALAWLLTRPFLFGIVTARTLRVVELGWARYMSGLWHPIVGCLVMIAVVLIAGVYMHGMGPISRLLLESLAGCAAYLTYNVLFNFSALQEVTETFTLSSYRFSRGSTALVVRR